MRKLINSYKKWNPSKMATILFLMVPFITFLFIDFKLDNDFWFLINTGKTIIKDGFITIEPFTIHSDLLFVPQQWLTDIIFNFIYSNFDIYGMYVFILLCNVVVIFIMYKIAYLMSNSRNKAILITVIVDMFLLSTRLITTRPQTFDIIIFLLELLLFELYIKKDKKKYLFFIPLLSLFMINAHASTWAMLFVLMIPYYAEYIILKIKKKDVYKIWPIIITTIVSLLIAFINPYGIEAIKYLFNSYGVSKINNLVYEMKPIIISNIVGKTVYLIILFVSYSFYHNKGNNKLRYFFLLIGISYITLNHYKSLTYLTIITPLILGYNFYSKKNLKEIKNTLLEKIVYVIIMVFIIVITLFRVTLIDSVDIKEFADYLDENASTDIKLFTDYNNGGYMEYRGYKCYIDPRAEVFLKANNKKEDIFDEYYDIVNYDIDIKEFLDKYNFDYLLVNSRLKYLLKELQNSSQYEEVLSKITDDKENITTYLFKRVSNS